MPLPSGDSAIPGGSVELDHNIYSLKQGSQTNVNILAVSSEKWVKILDNAVNRLLASI